MRRLRLYNPAVRMRVRLNHFTRAFLRVYPRCVTQAQAVAFNMFLAFFPILLLVLGVFSSSEALREEVLEMTEHLRGILPPESRPLVVEFLARPSSHAFRLVLLGLGGTLLAGAQMMKLLVTGFYQVYEEREPGGFGARQWRALLLLAVTIAPWSVSVVLTVFGKQVRAWVTSQLGAGAVVRGLWSLLYFGAVLLTAMLVLALVYRLGCPHARGWRRVLPGAAVATLLWWWANAAFGSYVRHVPYSLVYGGLAAVIGLMVWMLLTVFILFLGSALNAELLRR